MMDLTVVCRLCLSNNDSESLISVFNTFEKVANKGAKDIIETLIGIKINKEDSVSQKICTSCGEDLIKLHKFREMCLRNDKLLKDFQKKTSTRQPFDNLIHLSVAQLFHKYPGIKLPNSNLNDDFSPVVEMELNQVENYFKNKKIDMNRHIHDVTTNDIFNFKKSVSPINIKFKRDKSRYEIVKKCDRSDDGKLQNEIIDLLTSSISNSRKRKMSDEKEKDFSRIPKIISNVLIKAADTNAEKEVACEFCKNEFKSESILFDHLKNCSVKLTLENPPEKIKNLKRVEIKIPSPYIEISNSQFPDIDCNLGTIDLIRLLLKNEKFDRDAQTDPEQFPSNDSIINPNNNNNNLTPVKLKKLKPFLDVYRVPVILKHGEKLTIDYKTTKNPPKPTPKFEHWNELTPIDVRISKNTATIQNELLNTENSLSENSPIPHNTSVDIINIDNSTSIDGTNIDNNMSTDVANVDNNMPIDVANIDNNMPIDVANIDKNMSIDVANIDLNFDSILEIDTCIQKDISNDVNNFENCANLSVDNNYRQSYPINNDNRMSGNCLPDNYFSSEEFHNNVNNFINLNVNFYNNNNMKSGKIWYPPSSLDVVTTMRSRNRQPVQNLPNYNSINNQFIDINNYNSSYLNSSYHYSDYPRNENYQLNRAVTNDIFQNSGNNCDSNLNFSTIRVRPISDLK